MVKDAEGLNLIDICFLRRKTECAEFFIGILQKIQLEERAKISENQGGTHGSIWLQEYDFPLLLKIDSLPRWKSKQQIQEEKSTWDSAHNLVTRYGGEWLEKDYRKMITAWFKKNRKSEFSLEEEQEAQDEVTKNLSIINAFM